MAVIVFQMIALILERIEGFILHTPAATSGLLIQMEVLFAEVKVGHPAEAFGNRIVTTVKLIMLQKIDTQICIGLV